MSKFGCACGYIMIDQTDSLPFKGHISRDQDSDAFWETIEQFERKCRAGVDHEAHPEDEIIHFKVDHEIHMYECKQCGRIYIQKAPGLNEYVCYRPEDGKVHHILASTNDAERDIRIKQATAEGHHRFGRMFQRLADGVEKDSPPTSRIQTQQNAQ